MLQLPPPLPRIHGAVRMMQVALPMGFGLLPSPDYTCDPPHSLCSHINITQTRRVALAS